MIWRELVHRGGKPVLIGGANDFCEYVNTYYGVQSALSSQHVLQVTFTHVFHVKFMLSVSQLCQSVTAFQHFQ